MPMPIQELMKAVCKEEIKDSSEEEKKGAE
jgi:hypothetical protein